MRSTYLPFALPDTDDAEVEQVADALRSGWITTGPKTKLFEQRIADLVGAPHAVAVNSCTAAMHLALDAIGLQPGDEVITTPIPSRPPPRSIRYFNARPVLVDVEPETLNIDPALHRGGDHRRDPGHHPGPLRRPAGRHGRHLAPLPRRTACASSRTRRTPCRRSTRGG